MPATRRWTDVIGLIAEGAEVAKVAEATTHAWQLAFNKVRNDVGFREAVWLLTQLGVAGKSKDPAAHLSAVGLEVASAASVVEVAMAISGAMERKSESSRQRSDFGELAQRALVATVTEYFQKEMLPLLESRSEDIVAAVRKCGREKQFAELSKGFFCSADE